jgi:hypothetical protein
MSTELATEAEEHGSEDAVEKSDVAFTKLLTLKI